MPGNDLSHVAVEFPGACVRPASTLSCSARPHWSTTHSVGVLVAARAVGAGSRQPGLSCSGVSHPTIARVLLRPAASTQVPATEVASTGRRRGRRSGPSSRATSIVNPPSRSTPRSPSSYTSFPALAEDVRLLGMPPLKTGSTACRLGVRAPTPGDVAGRFREDGGCCSWR